MSTALATADILLRADDKALKRSLDKSEKDVNKFAAAAKKVLAAVFLFQAARGIFRIGKSFLDAAAKQNAAEVKLASVIRATGGAAGWTAGQLEKQARSLQLMTTVGDEVIINGQAILATFKEIKGDQFTATMQAALDMSTVLDTDLKSSVLQLGKALNDPITGISALTRSGVSFTEQQKEQIKTLTESGKIVEAQTIILGEMQAQFGGAAAAKADTFSGKMTQMGNRLGDVGEKMGDLIGKGLTPFIPMMEATISLIEKAIIPLEAFVNVIVAITEGFLSLLPSAEAVHTAFDALFKLDYDILSGKAFGFGDGLETWEEQLKGLPGQAKDAMSEAEAELARKLEGPDMDVINEQLNRKGTGKKDKDKDKKESSGSQSEGLLSLNRRIRDAANSQLEDAGKNLNTAAASLHSAASELSQAADVQDEANAKAAVNDKETEERPTVIQMPKLPDEPIIVPAPAVSVTGPTVHVAPPVVNVAVNVPPHTASEEELKKINDGIDNAAKESKEDRQAREKAQADELARLNPPEEQGFAARFRDEVNETLGAIAGNIKDGLAGDSFRRGRRDGLSEQQVQAAALITTAAEDLGEAAEDLGESAKVNFPGAGVSQHRRETDPLTHPLDAQLSKKLEELGPQTRETAGPNLEDTLKDLDAAGLDAILTSVKGTEDQQIKLMSKREARDLRDAFVMKRLQDSQAESIARRSDREFRALEKLEKTQQESIDRRSDRETQVLDRLSTSQQESIARRAAREIRIMDELEDNIRADSQGRRVPAGQQVQDSLSGDGNLTKVDPVINLNQSEVVAAINRTGANTISAISSLELSGIEVLGA